MAIILLRFIQPPLLVLAKNQCHARMHRPICLLHIDKRLFQHFLCLCIPAFPIKGLSNVGRAIGSFWMRHPNCD